MTSLSDPELYAFAAAVLERHGGLLEPADGQLLALLPSALARSLELPEEVHLGSEQAPLLYGSPLLDRLVGLATREAPVAYGQIELPYLKKSGFEQCLERDLSFVGGQVRLASRAEARTTYMILFCRYVALSDERKEGLLQLGLHEASGAVIPGLTEAWEECSPSFFPAGQVPPHFPLHLQQALAGGLKQAGSAVTVRLKDFLTSMRRRLGRDVRNTREYYEALRLEMEAGLSHHHLTESQRQERLAKIAALPQERDRKIADLEQKYQIRVQISACAALRFLVDVVYLLLELSCRRLTRSLRVIWNPLTKRLDPLVCEACHGTSARIYPAARNAEVRLHCPSCSRKMS
ncbi:MAG: hypothetical protein FJ128_08375 [Deltaproteobacteria bacterium]|nr:hypothetical protein [Deltaproteobacteria bacterium]